MESSQHYPNLPRYCFAWTWKVQFRAQKPGKKESVEWTEVLADDEATARLCAGFHCERKKWKLLEVYFLSPVVLAFAFDRDGPANEFLTTEQRRQLIPRPAPQGSEYRPLSAAERQAQQRAQRQQEQLARQQQRQQQQQQRLRHRLTTAYPLLADELLAAEYPQAA